MTRRNNKAKDDAIDKLEEQLEEINKAMRAWGKEEEPTQSIKTRHYVDYFGAAGRCVYTKEMSVVEAVKQIMDYLGLEIVEESAVPKKTYLAERTTDD